MRRIDLLRALLKKELRVHFDLLADYLAAFLVLVTVFPADSPKGFAILGALFGAGLAARLGGDETMHGTLEYVLTRPVARSTWVWLRFTLGLLPLALLAAGFFAADALDLHHRFGRLLSGGGVSAAVGVQPLAWPGPLAMVLLVYSLTFLFALGEARPEKVLDQRVTGILLAAVLCGVARGVLFWYAGGVERESLGLLGPADPQEMLAYAGMLLLVAVGAMFAAQGSFRRREVLGGEGALQFRTALGSTAVTWLVVAVIAVLLILAMVWLSAARPQ